MWSYDKTHQDVFVYTPKKTKARCISNGPYKFLVNYRSFRA